MPLIATGRQQKPILWRRVPAVVAVLALVGLLGGCAGGPVLGLAQGAVNGASFLATGKSADDHALSAVVNQDCQLSRVLESQDVCQPHPAFDSDATLADRDIEPSRGAFSSAYSFNATDRRSPARSDFPTADDTDSGLAAGAPPPPPVAMPASAGLPGGAGSVPDLGRYLVIGTFTKEGDAWVVAQRFGPLGARSSPVRRHGQDYYRVVVGPAESAGFAGLRRRLAGAGITGAWPVRLCRATVTPPPCRRELPAAAPAPVLPQDAPPDRTQLLVVR